MDRKMLLFISPRCRLPQAVFIGKKAKIIMDLELCLLYLQMPGSWILNIPHVFSLPYFAVAPNWFIILLLSTTWSPLPRILYQSPSFLSLPSQAIPLSLSPSHCCALSLPLWNCNFIFGLLAACRCPPASTHWLLVYPTVCRQRWSGRSHSGWQVYSQNRLMLLQTRTAKILSAIILHQCSSSCFRVTSCLLGMQRHRFSGMARCCGIWPDNDTGFAFWGTTARLMVQADPVLESQAGHCNSYARPPSNSVSALDSSLSSDQLEGLLSDRRCDSDASSSLRYFLISLWNSNSKKGTSASSSGRAWQSLFPGIQRPLQLSAAAQGSYSPHRQLPRLKFHHDFTTTR